MATTEAPKYKALTGKHLLAKHLSTATINAFEGSVRTGKTIGTLYDVADFCRNGPAGTIAMCGRTERTVINNLVIPMQAMFGPANVVINRGNGSVNIFGREVLLYGANNEAARTKIQGATLIAAYADEISTLPESFFDMLLSRLTEDGAKMWLTCNPEGPQHWFKKKWLDKAKLWVDHDGKIHRRNPDDYDENDPKRPIDLHRFSFILDDNAKNLPAKTIARLKASYSGLFYQRNILGKWALADGMVYSMFSEGRHVIPHDSMPTMERILGVGIDHGTTHPTAGIMLGLGTDHKLYVMDEWAPPIGLTVGEYAGLLRDWLKDLPEPEYIYIDPSAGTVKVEIRKAQIGRSRDATNSHAALYTIGALFSSGNLFISDRCSKLLNEIPGYVWDPKASERSGKDEVIKVDDDFADAMRYPIASTERIWRRYIPSLIEHKEAADAAA
ncbi:MAG: PBSX family phage terminase large subunit [Comamonadaceae bacterium]|nr:MAG: PBSX family phage terminase large subunit [Comamonadaceae bacterium]